MKAQIFSTDAFLSIVLFLLIISVFFNIWGLKLQYLSDNFNDRYLESKALTALDVLLSNTEIGIVDKYYHVSDYKLNNLIDSIENNNHSLIYLGLGDYYSKIMLTRDDGLILRQSSGFQNFTSYTVSARKNVIYNDDDAIIYLLVSRE